MSERSDLSDYERRLLDNVDRAGWHCTVVQSDGDAPAFAYSVGFTKTLNAPEFIVFGLLHDLMHEMLWAVFRQIADGRAVEDDDRWSGILQGHDCISRAVHQTNIVRHYLNSAMWFWGDAAERGPVPVFQLVWPNAHGGGFPWDATCPLEVRDSQPPLYLPNRELS